MKPSFANADEPTIPLHVIEKDSLESWREKQPESIAKWVESNGFSAGTGQALFIPASDGSPLMALAGYGTEKARERGRFHLAAAASKQPKGAYQIA